MDGGGMQNVGNIILLDPEISVLPLLVYKVGSSQIQKIPHLEISNFQLCSRGGGGRDAEICLVPGMDTDAGANQVEAHTSFSVQL